MNIGIIGDGQLGRMIAIAGYPLGLNFGFLGDKNSPSGNLGKVFSSIEELDNFADVITYESENTSVELIKNLNTKKVFPPIDALKITQNRTLEKALFKKLAINCAKNKTVNSLLELQKAVAEIKTPCILKTTVEGYDGKGQVFLKDKNEIENAWQNLEQREIIVEAFVDFDYEISMIAVFGKGERTYYPITKNIHKDGILRTSEVIEDSIIFEKAKNYIDKIADEFDYRGVLTMEFFVKNDELVANEIAPRVHNSGHWSINGAKVCQFENHLRAICDLPLGDTSKTYESVIMENIISKLPNTFDVLKDKNAFLHLYDKTERESRKLGHINYCK
jgi:5-(carboxyamino)imidazole ribonucleotide synthase